jgi:hypothetical protein
VVLVVYYTLSVPALVLDPVQLLIRAIAITRMVAVAVGTARTPTAVVFSAFISLPISLLVQAIRAPPAPLPPPTAAITQKGRATTTLVYSAFTCPPISSVVLVPHLSLRPTLLTLPPLLQTVIPTLNRQAAVSLWILPPFLNRLRRQSGTAMNRGIWELAGRIPMGVSLFILKKTIGLVTVWGWYK